MPKTPLDLNQVLKNAIEKYTASEDFTTSVANNVKKCVDGVISDIFTGYKSPIKEPLTKAVIDNLNIPILTDIGIGEYNEKIREMLKLYFKDQGEKRRHRISLKRK